MKLAISHKKAEYIITVYNIIITPDYIVLAALIYRRVALGIPEGYKVVYLLSYFIQSYITYFKNGRLSRFVQCFMHGRGEQNQQSFLSAVKI